MNRTNATPTKVNARMMWKALSGTLLQCIEELLSDFGVGREWFAPETICPGRYEARFQIIPRTTDDVGLDFRPSHGDDCVAAD